MFVPVRISLVIVSGAFIRRLLRLLVGHFADTA